MDFDFDPLRDRGKRKAEEEREKVGWKSFPAADGDEGKPGRKKWEDGLRGRFSLPDIPRSGAAAAASSP